MGGTSWESSKSCRPCFEVLPPSTRAQLASWPKTTSTGCLFRPCSFRTDCGNQGQISKESHQNGNWWSITPFEELSTFLCQIEACLNSCPLTQLSSDPLDLDPLTPGHLLITCPLFAIPELDFPPNSPNPSSSWRLIEKMHSDFWYIWCSEYLHLLQSSSKWLHTNLDIAPGQLVLIVDELTPSAKWPMARVINTSKGSDGHVRSVQLRTTRGETTSLRVKLCPLPVYDDVMNNKNEEWRAKIV